MCNLIVSTSYEPNTVIEQMQILVASCTRNGQRFNSLTEGDAGEGWGGSKYPECELWAGAFNFLNTGKFLAGMKTIPWVDHDEIQVFVKDQEDYSFHVYGWAELSAMGGGDDLSGC